MEDSEAKLLSCPLLFQERLSLSWLLSCMRVYMCVGRGGGDYTPESSVLYISHYPDAIIVPLGSFNSIHSLELAYKSAGP